MQCTGGKVVLGGGGSWSVTGGSANLLKVSPTDSLATSSTVWTFKVTVNTAFLLTDIVTVQAQAICGNP